MNRFLFSALKTAGRLFPKGFKQRLMKVHAVRYLCFGKFGATPYWEDRLEAFMRLYIKTGMNCIDVGANAGGHTRTMAELVGSQGAVYAYEAFGETAEVLRQASAAFPQVKAVHMAITDGSTPTITLHAGRNRSSAEWSIFSHPNQGEDGADKAAVSAEEDDGETVEVPAGALDELLGDAPVDFVKIDVEGAEPLVLKGMRKMLRAARPVVMVEFHSGAWHGRTELLEAGYDLYDPGGNRIDPKSETRSYHTYAFPPGFSGDPKALLAACGRVEW